MTLMADHHQHMLLLLLLLLLELLELTLLELPGQVVVVEVGPVMGVEGAIGTVFGGADADDELDAGDVRQGTNAACGCLRGFSGVEHAF